MNLIVTRHQALVTYLAELGITGEVKEHVNIHDVKGRHVYGVLPFYLACHAETFTEIPLMVLPGQRGKELTLEDIRSLAGEPATYSIKRIRDTCIYCKSDNGEVGLNGRGMFRDNFDCWYCGAN